MDNTYSFDNHIISIAQKTQGSIALAESMDPRVQSAALKLIKLNAVSKVALFGAKDAIISSARSHGLSLDNDDRILWVDESIEDLQDKVASDYDQKMRLKGRTIDKDKIKAWAASPINQSSWLVAQGIVDGGVAGCTKPTAEVIRSALMHIGPKQEKGTISSCFAMIGPQTEKKPVKIFMYADCAVMIDPDSDQLVDIAEATAHTFKKLFTDIEPKLAFLSFSTKGSARHAKQSKVATAFTRFKEKNPHIICDGELQFDAAIVSSIAEQKCPDSPLHGEANCFIFPNLDAGNIAYKITQRLGGFQAYGPILQGLAKPYNDLSRGASAEDIVIGSLITIAQKDSDPS
jgi:phosphate acetyltransferase